MVATGKHVVLARDRRRAGPHTSASNKHAKLGRHAATRSERTAGTVIMRRAFLAMRQRVLCVIQPARVRKLGGDVIDPHPPIWQVMIPAAQTPAFGLAAIVGLIIAAAGAAGPPFIAHKLTSGPGHALTTRGPATTTQKLASSAHPAPPLSAVRGVKPTGPGPNPTPTVHGEARKHDLDLDTPQAVPDLQPPKDDPDLETALNELDQQADRDQAWASRHPTPPESTPRCSPICADSNEPGPRPELNRPPAPGGPSTTQPPAGGR